MAQATIDIESCWREAWNDAPSGDGTFYDQLNTCWRSARSLNSAGSVFSVSKNNASQSAANPGGNVRTSVDVERTWLNAIQLYESLEKMLAITVRNETNENEIFNEGLAHFMAQRQGADYVTDFSTLRP